MTFLNSIGRLPRPFIGLIASALVTGGAEWSIEHKKANDRVLADLYQCNVQNKGTRAEQKAFNNELFTAVSASAKQVGSNHQIPTETISGDLRALTSLPRNCLKPNVNPVIPVIQAWLTAESQLSPTGAVTVTPALMADIKRDTNAAFDAERHKRTGVESIVGSLGVVGLVGSAVTALLSKKI
jgi:hypothetical protein